MITGNEPIAPMIIQASYNTTELKGLSIRQHFAILIMQGMLSNATYMDLIMKKVDSDEQASFLSMTAIEQADSLIEELNK